MRTLYESILDDEEVLIKDAKRIDDPYKLIKMWIKDCDNEKQISKSFLKVIDDYVISRLKQIPVLKNKEMEIFINRRLSSGPSWIRRSSPGEKNTVLILK